MGFSKMYKLLKEIFPQIDARALRAVAIEHSKDADAAVDAVLQEIVPFFTERSAPNTPSTGSTDVGEPSTGAIATTKTSDGTSVHSAAGSTDGQNEYIANVWNQHISGDANDGHSEHLRGTSDGHREGESVMAELTMSGSIPEIHHENKNSDGHREGESVMAELTMSGSIPENHHKNKNSDGHHDGESVMAELTMSGSIPENNMQKNTGSCSRDELVQLMETDGVHHIQIESVEPKTDSATSDGKCQASSIQLASDNDRCQPFRTLKEKDTDIDQNVNILRERADKRCLQIGFDTAVVEDSDQGSRKTHMIDALAKIIADARNNKKMLFSAMDSVISLMREVELKEKAAEQAKVEAAMGDTDILVKSEELKQIVKQAEEANFMHAGEVYGEKAILATELRELQSRALSLSVERDKYLAVLHEMQQTLEVRLAEAQNVIKSAEEIKIEKEAAAMKSLTQMELIMEKVLQEAKSLNQQAEDNAKLREFLVDRGHVVDMLQGEISVICQDVRMLKEKFDEHIPFSKSLSSSQTSFVLASSGSSSKSLIPELVESLNEGANPMDNQEKKGVTFGSTEHSSQDEAAKDDHKAHSDDEWEIFDRDYLVTA